MRKLEGKKKRAWSRRKLTPQGKAIRSELVRRDMRVGDLAKVLGIKSENYLSQIMYGAVGSGKYTDKINEFLAGKKIS